MQNLLHALVFAGDPCCGGKRVVSLELGHRPYRDAHRAQVKAKRGAAAETDMSKDRFPKDSPFSFEQALDETFWPE